MDVPGAAHTAPEFHRNSPDMDLISMHDPRRAAFAARILDVAADELLRERSQLRALEQAQVEAEEEARTQQAHGAASATTDTRAALEAAIRRHGRAGHLGARAALGDEVYEAIRRLAPGACWSWLCQQAATEVPALARRLDAILGRAPAPAEGFKARRPWVDRSGGGSHHRNTSDAPAKVAVPSEKVGELLLPMLRGRGLYACIEDFKDYKLCARDWNVLMGQTVKKVDKGFVAAERFAAYFQAVVRNWERDHPIKARGI